MRTCFLSSQMNAIGGFSVRLNGFRPGHPAKMSSRQKLACGLSGTHVENQSPNQGRPGTKRGGPVVAVIASAALHERQSAGDSSS